MVCVSLPPFVLTIDTIIFCSCDVLSLVVQAVGGATASFAVQNGGNPTKVSSLLGLSHLNIHPNSREDTSCLQVRFDVNSDYSKLTFSSFLYFARHWDPNECVLFQRNEIPSLTVDCSPVAITVYTMCATEFFLRFLKDKPVRGDATSHKFEEESTVRVDIRMKIMVIALTFTTTCLFIR